jgi:hypothetical protein
MNSQEEALIPPVPIDLTPQALLSPLKEYLYS